MSKIDEKYRKKFGDYSNKPYAEQSKLFLNAFWDDVVAKKIDAEEIWKFTQKFIELDQKLHAGGHDLDEFEAHKFLESLGETMTVMALRERLRTIDLDSNNRMSMCEYLVFKYKKTVADFCNAPQGDNKKEIDEAQEKVDSASKALAVAQEKLEESKAAAEELKKQLHEQKQIQTELEENLRQQKLAQDELDKQLKEQKEIQTELEENLRQQKIAQELLTKQLHEQKETQKQLENELAQQKNC